MKKMHLKKTLMIGMMLLATTMLFAEGSYRYVDSSEGLRVRDAASLSANRISGLTHMQKVKVVETGPAVTIDGIASNWMKIELPSVAWASTTPEYGWVFGGYLTTTREETVSKEFASIFTPSIRNTSEIRLDINPSHSPVTRKDFSLGDEATMHDYAIATNFGKKVYVRQDGEYVWFDNLAPYTTIYIEADMKDGWLKTWWCNTECYVRPEDVTRGAIAGFALKDTAILSSASAGATTGKKYTARQFIAVTDFSDETYVKTTEGWVAKADIWTYQADVGILQAFQRDLEAFDMNDASDLKWYTLINMLQLSTRCRETNLFYMEREYMARLWKAYVEGETVWARGTLNEYLQQATTFEKYFSDTATLYFQENDYMVPTHGNYIAGSFYSGIIALSDNEYKSAFWCTPSGTIIALHPYYDTNGWRNRPGDKQLALDLNLAKRAADAKTDSECERYLNMLTYGYIKNNSDIIGYDDRERIEPYYSEKGILDDSNGFRTVGRIPMQANPGTRFKVTGYLEKDTVCTPVQMVMHNSRESYNYAWIYVESKGGSGWVKGCDLYQSNGEPVSEGIGWYQDYTSELCYLQVRSCEETCVAYSWNGTDIPLYGVTDKRVKGWIDESAPATFINGRSAATPIAYIPHGAVMDATYTQTFGFDGVYDFFTRGTLYYVTYNGVSGWLLPENCMVKYFDTADHLNAYDKQHVE